MSAFEHARQKRVDPANYAKDVDAEAPLPVGQVHVLEGAAQDDAGVVHQQADRPQI